ncbi:actin-like protein ARP6 [Kwoniella dejecticola CBS 10117]|uniref:Actin-like protein ARP6 n=1 Tax=Kwoniella dejecticola CBS 10117 TaxID=1296121 RepID=A0A1A6AC05_9TREE|nr:actin-like protein ARP6 [Kwoniella dejecticola CBS 10117]OBR87601.1 actin-like protein ARP6 [Kwoniella dejecticola CBS 10117]
MTTPPIVILDNGAYEIKAGISGVDEEPRRFPNSIARSRTEKQVYVSDEIDRCKDLSGIVYRRPFEKGMLVNWDAEKVIWDRVFSPAGLNINPTESSLLVTEPYFNLPNIAETYDQMVFEEWEFQSYFRCTPAALIPYGGLFENESFIPPECTILVDVGYSSTHVIPLRDGQIIWDHVKRIDVGGKLLTNHLKHLISFRQWNMIDQTHVVNDVREACGYVSMDWRKDLELCKQNPRTNPIVQEYVLPDFSSRSTSRTGYIRSGPNAQIPDPESSKQPEQANGHGKLAEEDEEQILIMGNERFAGPELLFNPSDIGLEQSGLPETIARVISCMPEELRGMYWAHIGIFGGLGNIDALGERLERDLQALCPVDYEIGIYEAFDPASPPYVAATTLTASEIYLSTYPVTRAEYQEHGSSICRRRFGGPAYNVNPPGFTSGEMGGEVDEDERERRYAMGLESKKGKGKKRKEEEEVISGNWGGRRRRAGGLL